MQRQPTKHTIGSKETLQFIWDIAKRFPVGIAVMIFVAIYWAFELTVTQYLLKILLNRASEGTSKDLWYLGYPAMLWLAMTTRLTITFRMYDYFVSIKMIPNMRKYIVDVAMEKLLMQSHNFYQNNFSGSLSNKTKDLISNIPETIQIITDRFLSISILSVMSMIMLWSVNIIFGMIMLIWVIFFLTCATVISKYLIRLSDNFSERGSIVIGSIVDALSNIMLIKLFARDSLEKSKISDVANDALIAEKKVGWLYLPIQKGSATLEKIF